MCASRRRLATPYSVARAWGAVDQATIGVITGGFDRIASEALVITGSLGSHPIAIEWHAPKPHLAAAPRGLAAASHSVRDQGALILGHGTPDREAEVIVRILTSRPLQKRHLAPPLRQFVEQASVVDIVPGQLVWSGDQEPLKAGPGRAVA
jgi:hypothetical protein